MSDKATEKELAEVHGKLAEWCMLVMQGTPLLDKEGAAVLKPDGQPWLVPPSPAYLNVIRQLLKDNKIEAVATHGTPLGDLSDLPMFDDDNVVPIKAR
jgi:hypothetical protein